MRIRTAIFGVYLAASLLAFAAVMTLVLRDVRRRYVESMRRTLGDTAVFLASFAAEGASDGDWTQRLAALPANADLLRVFASDASDRVIFDAGGRDVGLIYNWPDRGGGPVASENYTLANVAQTGTELRVRAAVRHEGVLLGWVGVGRPLSTVSAGIKQARLELVKYVAWIALVVIAAGWWIAARLTRSLERLTAYANAVRDGHPAEPPESRASEIAALSRAFEEMRLALEGKAQVERYTQALAHEFKAPLSSIRGAAELLTEDMPREDRARFVANVRAESDRMQRLVDRLLDLSALEARRGAESSTLIKLESLLQQVATELSGIATQRGVRLDLSHVGETAVRGDALLLAQAIGNLVQNAIEFSPPQSVVQVTTSTRGGRVDVSVDDNGPGVPAYALEKVFDRFYSLPRPDSGRKSSGLGLSIVREIARLHGGEVTVANRRDGGARATLALPAA